MYSKREINHFAKSLKFSKNLLLLNIGNFLSGYKMEGEEEGEKEDTVSPNINK